MRMCRDSPTFRLATVFASTVNSAAPASQLPISLPAAFSSCMSAHGPKSDRHSILAALLHPHPNSINTLTARMSSLTTAIDAHCRQSARRPAVSRRCGTCHQVCWIRPAGCCVDAVCSQGPSGGRDGEQPAVSCCPAGRVCCCAINSIAVGYSI
ncbi:hypothetical protein BCR44DRAFT_390355 [Catenaria anguillulae PL171]|uniref:Uncharacterized protein n=1 Tax=Catenaria anguillulae PL171 TaxID=765915 RepID=A0A1Y2HS80_9FUNG|nr:hypothetical protein BCR44DRAFT_390355 [Catenaria anguillulae PL171]